MEQKITQGREILQRERERGGDVRPLVNANMKTKIRLSQHKNAQTEIPRSVVSKKGGKGEDSIFFIYILFFSAAAR